MKPFCNIALAILLAQLGISAASAQTPPPFGPAVAPGRTLQTADMTNANPLIPGDIYRTATVSQADLATFAWLEFISAVAPANSGQRGVPGGSFAKSAASSAGPLVWETYQHRSELFPYNAAGGVAPQPWGATPKYVMSVTKDPNTKPPTVVSYTVPFSQFNNLDEANQIGQNTLFFPKTPGNPQPSTDTQVLFEAKVNQYESQFVAANYTKLIPIFSPFRLSPPITLPTTTVEVKAAWRPLSSIPQNQQNRYHTATVITYSGTDAAPVAQTSTWALIALHIIHKTPNYPAFIFATFEQVDSFQNQVTKQPTGVYYVPAYTSIAYTAPTTSIIYATPPFPPKGTTVQDPTITLSNGAFNPQKPYAAPNGNLVALPLGAVTTIPGAKTVGGIITVPVTSPVQTVPEVATVNNQALAAMKAVPGFGPNFVWQYYKLTGVQAIPTNDETSKDFYLANIVVESSQPGIQLFRGFPPITNNVLTNIRNQVNVIDSHNSPATMTSSGGCQGCHGVAQTQNGFDFSFLFFGVNGGGFSPEVSGLPTPAVAASRQVTKKYLK